jgi:hypothetical protein
MRLPAYQASPEAIADALCGIATRAAIQAEGPPSGRRTTLTTGPDLGAG